MMKRMSKVKITTAEGIRKAVASMRMMTGVDHAMQVTEMKTIIMTGSAGIMKGVVM